MKSNKLHETQVAYHGLWRNAIFRVNYKAESYSTAGITSAFQKITGARMADV